MKKGRLEWLFTQVRSGALVSVVTAIGTIVAAVFGLVSSNGSRRLTEQIQQGARDMRQTDFQVTLAEELDHSRKQNAEIAALLNEITSPKKSGLGAVIGMSMKDRADLREAIANQKQLSVRLSALESALMNDPAKALALPLLKKDVNALQDREKTDSEVTRAEIDHLYTFSEWFMALMVSTAVAILGLAIPRLIGAKRETQAAGQSQHVPSVQP